MSILTTTGGMAHTGTSQPAGATVPVTFTLASSQPKTLRSAEGEKQKGPTFSSLTPHVLSSTDVLWQGGEGGLGQPAGQSPEEDRVTSAESQQAPPRGAGVDVHWPTGSSTEEERG